MTELADDKLKCFFAAESQVELKKGQHKVEKTPNLVIYVIYDLKNLQTILRRLKFLLLMTGDKIDR